MIEIKNRWSGEVAAIGIAGETIAQAVERIVRTRGSNLCGADLCGADLCGADLRSANLCGSDLCGAKQHVCRIQGRRHEINAINDDVRIGCIRHPLAYWLEHFREIGEKEKYTKFEIAEYGLHLQHIAALLELRKTVEENL